MIAACCETNYRNWYKTGHKLRLCARVLLRCFEHLTLQYCRAFLSPWLLRARPQLPVGRLIVALAGAQCPCTSPSNILQVSNLTSCREGATLAENTNCTTACADGYVPNQPTIACPSSTIRAPLFAARTLNATGQCRVTLSRR